MLSVDKSLEEGKRGLKMNWLGESGAQPLLGTFSKIKKERKGRAENTRNKIW